MPKAASQRLDEVLAPSAYRFLVLELVVKDERDVPGLIRYKLEELLPRGLEGFRCFFRRIGTSRRFLVTLIRNPIPDAVEAEKLRLPFALTIPATERRAILWTAREASSLVRYEGGRLVSIETYAADESHSAVFSDGPLEQRIALTKGLCIQGTAGRVILWKITAALLGLSLACQLALAAAGAYTSRESKLAALEEAIAVIERRVGGDPLAMLSASAGESGLQSRADEVFRRLSTRWEDGCYLSAFKLKGSKLKLEGWGTNALTLLGSLRSDPSLAGLELSSRKYHSGYETFIFEGELRDD
jgi:hypothetical protein